MFQALFSPYNEDRVFEVAWAIIVDKGKCPFFLRGEDPNPARALLASYVRASLKSTCTVYALIISILISIPAWFYYLLTWTWPERAKQLHKGW